MSATTADRERIVLANNDGIIHVHMKLQSEYHERQLALMNERMKHLKSNDVEGYIEMLRTAKTKRIDALLQQTVWYESRIWDV